ncbi:MAG: hypothetical protein J7K26_02270 [Candidatus Aenigmarchaeota archaeon]|nr:hypothetical protein [Candidatus Aenigmarchaeota archaeon]
MDKNKAKENFDIIFDEIIRQFSICQYVEDSHNRKLTFIMGFVAIVISIIFTQQTFFNQTYTIITKIIFIIGLLFILSSGIIAFLGYKGRKWYAGIDIKHAMNLYKKNPSRNFKMIIAKFIANANYVNRRSIDTKGKLLNWSYVFMGIGLIIFIFLTLQMLFNFVIV